MTKNGITDACSTKDRHPLLSIVVHCWPLLAIVAHCWTLVCQDLPFHRIPHTAKMLLYCTVYTGLNAQKL